MDENTCSIDKTELLAAQKNAQKLASQKGISSQQITDVLGLYTAAQRVGFSEYDSLEIACGLTQTTHVTASNSTATSIDAILQADKYSSEEISAVINGVYESVSSRKKGPGRVVVGMQVYQRSQEQLEDIVLIGVDAQQEQIDQEVRKLFCYNPLLGTNFEQSSRMPGVLLSGPPGTGKSSLVRYAKKQAKYYEQVTGISFTYESIQSRHQSKWLGESAKTVHEVFRRASNPSGVGIIAIDDIDLVISKRSNHTTAVGMGLTSQLMQELDGVDSTSNQNTLLLATTNRPQDLDEAIRNRRLPLHLRIEGYDSLTDYKLFVDAYASWLSESCREVAASYLHTKRVLPAQSKSMLSALNAYRRGPVLHEVLSAELSMREQIRTDSFQEVGVTDVYEVFDSFDCAS